MSDQVTREFERERPRLRAVAYRMLGSHAEAEDAVQEAWLRLSRSDRDQVRNLQAWLTTVVGRVCLDLLRARKARRETALEPMLVTAWREPADDPARGDNPEQEAALAESVGVALMVVLEALTPAERLAFVLHDLFGVPFAEVGPMLDRSADAAKMLASRARQRVRGATPQAADLARQRRVVEAFRAASRSGDLEALVALLDPDVEVVSDTARLRPGAPLRVRGARTVAAHAVSYRPFAPFGHPVLVDGLPGVVVRQAGARPIALLRFTISRDRITRLDVVTDPDALATLDLSALD